MAGIEWLERVEQELARHDLKPLKLASTQKFRGLGGAKREAAERWIVPVGLGGRHTVQQYYAIPGSMIGLTGRDDLEDWSTNLYLRKEGHWADFEGLGVYNKELIKTKKGHAGLDIFDYNYDTYSTDPVFEKFRKAATGKDDVEGTPDALSAEAIDDATEVKAEKLESSWVSQAVRDGRRGVIKRGTLKRIEKLMKEYSVIFDVLRDDGQTFA